MGVVIREDPVRGSFEVIELAAAQRPPENGARGEHQHDGKGDQEVQDFQDVSLV